MRKILYIQIQHEKAYQRTKVFKNNAKKKTQNPDL